MKLAVNEPSSRVLEAWQGKRVIMGLRPEHLALGDGVVSRSFVAKVEVVEVADGGEESAAEGGGARFAPGRRVARVPGAGGDERPG